MKKLTAFLLALCLTLPILPAHASEEPPAWAGEAYAALKERHVIIGLVGPSPVKRGEFVDMLIRLLDFFSQKLGHAVKAEGSPAVYADAGKISAWALPYTERIAAYGLMKGDSYGNFDPQGGLDYSPSVVLAYRIMELLDGAVNATQDDRLTLQSQVNWSGAAQFGSGDGSMARPLTGWARGYYTIDNGDGTVSGLVVGTDAITVERFNADGSLASSKTVERELPIFGSFLDSGSRFYLVFGQNNGEQDDNKEVWRIVQYDRDWNRLGSASVTAGDSYTTSPFASTVSRMEVSADGKTLALHAARSRYTAEDGLRHQSNITITVNTADRKVLSVSEPFPGNHVSHSFGQFVRFDGEEMVTVDHGDAYPRAFVLHDDAQEAELLKIAGSIGNNVTNAIGSGLEISEDGYLFLGCSDPQDGTGGPWNVFLSYTSKKSKEPTLTWLTHSDTTIDCARLVKLDKNTFVAMWQYGADVHYQKLDGKGQLVGQEQVYPHALMPPTDPVVMDGEICWIQYSVPRKSVLLYRLEVQ